MIMLYRLKLIALIYWRKIKRKCGNRELEKLERWYDVEYNHAISPKLLTGDIAFGNCVNYLPSIPKRCHTPMVIGQNTQRIRICKNGNFGFVSVNKEDQCAEKSASESKKMKSP